MPLLRRCDANSGCNVRPATGVPDHRAANSEKEATRTKQANDFRGRIFSREDIFARGYFREKIFSREDIFAGRYFRVNSKFAKISSRENISNSLFAKFSSRENKVLYSIRLRDTSLFRFNTLTQCSFIYVTNTSQNINRPYTTNITPHILRSVV